MYTPKKPIITFRVFNWNMNFYRFVSKVLPIGASPDQKLYRDEYTREMDNDFDTKNTVHMNNHYLVYPTCYVQMYALEQQMGSDLNYLHMMDCDRHHFSRQKEYDTREANERSFHGLFE